MPNVIAELFFGGGVVPNIVPPTVEMVSPANGTILAPHDTVVVDITDIAPGIGLIIVWVRTLGERNWLGVYDGSSFMGSFSASTVESVIGGMRLRVRRSPKWLAPRLFMRVVAVDQAGNILE